MFVAPVPGLKRSRPAARRGVVSATTVALAVIAFLAALAPPALAGTPTTVTVRVQGLGGETLLPQTTVTTTTAAVPVEGGTCSGTSVGGALYDAVHGNWKAKAASLGVEILGIEGLDFGAFSATEPAGIFWAIWMNDRFTENGACSEELSSPGAHLVFYPQCYEVGPDCPTKTTPDHFLTETPPSSAVVNVGEKVSVTIGSLSTESATAEPALPGGTTVSAGAESASPGTGGVATFTFSQAGTYTLQAHAPDSVPSDPYTVCVHDGNDGTCGTATPGGAPQETPLAGGAGGPHGGPFALVADITGVLDNHRYSRRHGPRLLTGKVTSDSAIENVELRLTRTVRAHGGTRRCSYFNGRTERFHAMRCGASHGRFFSVGDAASFSYLLPFGLAPGRYVLDVQATDATGNHAPLARGSSRVVFGVG